MPAETYEQEAAATAVRRFMDQVKQESEMDTVEMKGSMENSFGLPNARFREKLVMMPVWLLAHRQGQRVVYTAINGQSGEVVCDIPVSNSKMIGLSAVLTALLFLLLQQFLTLRPELLLGLYGLIALAAHLLFSSTQKQLYRRRTRAGEPDFEDEEKSFAGAAQSLLRMKDGRVLSGKKSSFSKAGDLLTWIVGGIVFLVLFLLPSLDEMTSAERKDLVTIGMGVLVAVMGIHTFLRAKKPDAGPLWPRLLCLAACGAGFLCLAAGQVQDLYYYACAAAVLISSLIELILVNRAHNEYASRPVPFFDGKEAAE